MPYILDPITGKRVYKRPSSTASQQAEAQKKKIAIPLGSLGATSQVDLLRQENTKLLDLAKKAQVATPTFKDRALNVLRGVGRVLNVGTATVAGATRGILSKEKTIAQGIEEGLKDNISFGDVIKEDLGIQPTSKLGKVTLGAVGLAADILFDPITYLTFGAGAGIKIGGRVLTKPAQKLLAKAVQESATQVGRKTVLKRRIVNELFNSSASKVGLKESVQKSAREAGISLSTIKKIEKLGSNAFDVPGIKFAGKTLISSSKLEHLPIIRQSLALAKSSKTVQDLKTGFGKAFAFDYGRNKTLSKIFEKANITKRLGGQQLIAKTKKTFDGLNLGEQQALFQFLHGNKVKAIKIAEEIETKMIEKFNSNFPDLVLKNKEDAVKLIPKLEDITEKEMSKLREQMDNIVSKYFSKREIEIKSGKIIGETTGLQTRPGLIGFSKIDQLNKDIDELLKSIKAIKVGRIAEKEIKLLRGAEEVTKSDIDQVFNRLLISEEERLVDIKAKLLNRLAKKKTKITKEGKQVFPKLSETDLILSLDKTMRELQQSIVKKESALREIFSSRSIAKLSQRKQLDDLIKELPTEKLRLKAKEIVGEGGLVERLAKMAKIPREQAFATYIPDIKKAETGKHLFNFKSPLGQAKFDYTKEFGNRIASDELETNLFTAYSKQQLKILHDNLTTNATMKVVRSFGKKLDDEIMNKYGGEIPDSILKQLGLKKFERNIAPGKKITAYLDEAIHKELTDFIENTNNFRFIDELARATGFDWSTGLFKGYVTSLFPGFHIRNLTSNVFQGMIKLGLASLNPRSWKLGAMGAARLGLKTKIGTKTGKVYTLGEIIKIAEERGLYQTAFSPTEQFIEETSKQLTKQKSLRNFIVTDINPLSRENIALRAGRSTGNLIENTGRLSYFISELASGKNIDDAVESVELALFNYSKLTPFEKSVMRRLIPFYSFSRKNAELQLRTLAKTPGRHAAIFKLFNNVEEATGESITPEELDGLPSWTQEQLGFKAGTDEFGRPEVIYSFGLPTEEFFGRFSGEKGIITNAIHDTLSKFNPIFRFPLERAMGKDVFYNKEIVEIDNAENFKWFLDAMPEGVSQEMKSLLDWHETEKGIYANGIKVGTEPKYVADPMKLHLLRNMFFSRFINTGGKLTDEQTASWIKTMQFITGFKVDSIDVEEQTFFKELEKNKELKRYLYRLGVIGTKEIIFEKKPESVIP